MPSNHSEAAALGRALSAQMIQAADDHDARGADLAPMAAGDMCQTVQCPVQGLVGSKPRFADLTVTFPFPYYLDTSQLQQDGVQTDPHFATGVHLLTDQHVCIEVVAKAWLKNGSSAVTGAKLQVMSWIPWATKSVRFKAIVHITTFGYAAPTEDDSEG